MIEMTHELKKQLLDLGRNAIDSSKTDIEIFKKLIINSKEVVTNKIGKRELPECDVYYTSTANPELLLWAVGLISIHWTLYLLKQKAVEGIDCRTHYKQTGLPCSKSQKFHDELFDEVKKSFEELVKHDYEKEIKNEEEESCNKGKKIILIMRAYNNKKIKGFIERFYKNDNKDLFEKIIVLVNCEEETDHYTQTLLSRCKDDIFEKLEIIHVKPWGVASGALNIGLTKAFDGEKKPDYILIASPEVELKDMHVKKMSDTLKGKPNMLVVGYALEAFEKGHVKDKDACDALRVPWNTCAMWNAEKFREYVGAFNIICDCSNYLGNKLQGMEDALAIVLAKSNNPALGIGMIWKTPPKWEIDIKDKEKHIKKMKRKSSVYSWYKENFDSIQKLGKDDIETIQ